MGSEQESFTFDEAWMPLTINGIKVMVADVSIERINGLVRCGVVYAVFGAYLISSAGVKCGEHNVSRTIAALGVEKQALKQTLLRHEIARAVGVAKPATAVAERTEADDVFDEMLKKWKGKDSCGDKRNYWIPFSTDLLVFCVEKGIEFDFSTWCDGSVEIRATRTEKLLDVTTDENGIRWTDFGYWKMTVISASVAKAILSRSGEYVIVRPLVFVLTAQKEDVDGIRSFYRDVKSFQRNIIAGLKQEEKKKVVTIDDQFLSKTNFYELVRKQLAAKPGQNTFFFKPFEDEEDNAAFVAALKASGKWRRLRIPFVHAVTAADGSIDDGVIMRMCVLVVTMIFLAVSGGSFLWHSYMDEAVAALNVFLVLAGFCTYTLAAACTYFSLAAGAKRLVRSL